MQFLKKNKIFFFRFINFNAVGIITTIFGLLLFYIFIVLLSIDIYISHVIVFIFSVGFSAIINSIFIYRKPLNISFILIFYRSYFSSFVFGLVLILILRNFLPSLNDFVVIILMVLSRTLITFVLVEKFLNLKAD